MVSPTLRIALLVAAAQIASVATAGVNAWTSAGPAVGFGGPERIDRIAADPSRPATVYANDLHFKLYRTIDGGRTWSSVLPQRQFATIVVGPSGIAYAGGVWNQPDLRSTDEGETWFPIRPLHHEPARFFRPDPGNPSVVYVATVRSTGGPLEGDLFRSPDGCLTWIQVGSGLGRASLRDLEVDPFDSTRLHAISDSGYHVSRDSGSTWTTLANGLPAADLRHLVFDPTTPDTVYAAGDAGLFRSRNAGATFDRIDAALPAESFVNAVVPHPIDAHRVFVSMPWFGIYETSDGGETWRPFNDGLHVLATTDLGMDRSGVFLHTATVEGVFDRELRGDREILRLGSDHPFRIALTARDPRSGRASEGRAVFQNGLFGSFSVPGLTSDPDGPEVVAKIVHDKDGSVGLFYAALTDLDYTLTVTEEETGRTRTYSRTGGGACGGYEANAWQTPGKAPERDSRVPGRWSRGSLSALEVWSLGVDPERPGKLYAHAHSGATKSVYTSENSGATWEPTSLPLRYGALASGPQGNLYAASSAGVFYRSTDQGTNWRVGRGAQYGAPSFIRVDPRNPEVLYMGTHSTAAPGGSPPAGDVVRSVDGGLTWISIQDPYNYQNLSLGFGVVTDLTIDPRNSSVLHAVKSSGYYRSENRGNTWRRLFLPFGDPAVLALDPRFEGVIYAGGASGLYRSIDAGRSFSRVGIGLPTELSRTETETIGWWRGLLVDPSRTSRLFAALYGRGVYVSVDGGETWKPYNDGLEDLRVLALALDPTGRYLHAGTRSGVFSFDLAAPSSTLALSAGRRFAATLTALDPRSGRTGFGIATALSGQAGFFSLPDFTGASDNPEVFVKVVDGRAINGRFWLFYGGLTDLEYTLTVTEEETGRVKTYFKPAGSACGGIDTEAFGP